MASDEQADDDQSIVRVAVVFPILSLPLTFSISRVLAEFSQRETWVPWLLAMLFTLFPMSLTFIVLYSSHWHREWPVATRIWRLILVTLMIFCADVLLLGYLALISSFGLNCFLSGG